MAVVGLHVLRQQIFETSLVLISEILGCQRVSHMELFPECCQFLIPQFVTFLVGQCL